MARGRYQSRPAETNPSRGITVNMYNFRGSPRPAPFLNRRDQLRLLALVAAFAIVVFAIRIASRPSAWAWMWRSASRGTAQRANPVGQPDTATDDFNTGQIVTEPLPPGVVQAAADGETFRVSERAEAPALLDPRVLEPVEDDSPVRADEADAYFYSLSVARDAVTEDVERRARRDVTFALLYREPELYRGEFIQLEGYLRRLIEYPAGENDYGIETLYEAWLFTEDSQQNPYVVICTRVPLSMPRGDDLTERVRVAGFFFKRYAYRAGDAWRVAPMLLANRLVRLRPAQTGGGLGLATYIVGFLVAVAVVLGTAGWYYAREDRRFRSTHEERLRAPRSDELESLRELQSQQSDESQRPSREIDGES